MSIFTKQAVVAVFPAFTIVEREADSLGFVQITAQDLLGLDSGRGFYRKYQPGSVVSYALAYNECPIEAVEDCRAKMVKFPYNGHKLHWINACASVISDSPRPSELLVKVTIGMAVNFEGHKFTIQADHNNNLRFAPIE